MVCFDGQKMTDPNSIRIFNDSLVKCEFNNIKDRSHRCKLCVKLGFCRHSVSIQSHKIQYIQGSLTV